MKRSLGILAVLFLTGCQSANIGMAYKQGVSQAKRLSDIDSCRIQALKAVPPSSQTTVIPGTYTPGYSYCTAYYCETTPGYSSPTTVYTTDPNASLRDRQKVQCLRNKGYKFVEVPRCRSKEEKDKFIDLNQLPPANQIACAVDFGEEPEL
ncbi:hypothetical protein HCG46_26130 [Labrenzia sp. PO1]|uniref:hypothetical protein n=1 Tax=Labrenzia sp. PO1 TaxID=2720390 RepID=UPI0014486615|nr:hypothetical protein [Labrenzia sp. PO1]NKI61780.1 hypothetical protein [Labrenzia sp. PO1]